MPSLIDDVGYWTEIKLKILKEYAAAYAKILSKRPHLHFVYIDAFAGAGVHVSKSSGEVVKGSPLIALETKPYFSHYFFIERNKKRIKFLQEIAAGRKNVTILHGNCNEELLSKVFPQCQYKDYRRALCFLDPYGLNPNWEVVETAGKMKSVEIFLTFMIVGANRNVLLSKYSRISARQRARMNTFWGDPSWQEAAYKEQRSLFHDMDKLLKQPNIEIANAYKKRLLEVAGFKYVPDPIPMKTTTGSVMYYLFFATHNEIGAKIIRSIFKKYRTAGIIYGN